MLERLRRDARALGALEDELRRSLYLFVRAGGRPVNREEAAAAVGISRKLAAFHLDKLVDRGLLTFTYERPPGRGGRGAGRSAKYYRPSDREVEVSIPERRYDLLGSVLLRALRSREPGEAAGEAAGRAARETGFQMGRDERQGLGIPPAGPERTMALAVRLLERTGFEPYEDEPGSIRLRSCPFQALAERDRDLVCGMNHCLIGGVVAGLGSEAVDVLLDPLPGGCCVTLKAPAH
ncbi:MAG TPA: transcriptional regulator [Actinomycetota bacterium]|jgi:predicted ArsR family transcriptional regulator|nr:transcriptional regulator [Actinomycetota bacterium]